jgi:hypothetical protein
MVTNIWEEPAAPPLHLKMGAAGSFETLVTNCRIICCHIPAESLFTVITVGTEMKLGMGHLH